MHLEVVAAKASPHSYIVQRYTIDIVWRFTSTRNASSGSKTMWYFLIDFFNVKVLKAWMVFKEQLSVLSKVEKLESGFVFLV